MYLYIFYTFVIRLVKMFPYFAHRSVVADVIEMGLEPVHDAIFGLSYVLFSACLAGHTINHIGAFACDILFCHVFSACDVAFDSACFVDVWAISAVFCVAGIARFGWVFALTCSICGFTW